MIYDNRIDFSDDDLERSKKYDNIEEMFEDLEAIETKSILEKHNLLDDLIKEQALERARERIISFPYKKIGLAAQKVGRAYRDLGKAFHVAVEKMEWVS